jgi:hypothetical protein
MNKIDGGSKKKEHLQKMQMRFLVFLVVLLAFAFAKKANVYDAVKPYYITAAMQNFLPTRPNPNLWGCKGKVI